MVPTSTSSPVAEYATRAAALTTIAGTASLLAPFANVTVMIAVTVTAGAVGWLTAVRAHHQDVAFVAATDRCARCRGTGEGLNWLVPDDDCRDCGGSGNAT